MPIFLIIVYNNIKEKRFMAKFALVGYGSDGRGLGKTKQGYTYVVNDNVRTGDTIQPIATSSKGRKFATTGVINHAYKETSVKGQEAKQSAEQNGATDVTQVYSGKELGVRASRVPPKAPEGSKPLQSQYAMETRAGNIAMQLKKDPQTKLTEKAYQTFEEYSKPFMKQGE